MIRIRFEPSGKELEIAGPEALMDVIDELPGTQVSIACRAAHCAACRVCVEQGHNSLEPAAADERATLRALGAAPNQRLACQLRVRAAASDTIVLRVLSAP